MEAKDLLLGSGAGKRFPSLRRDAVAFPLEEFGKERTTFLHGEVSDVAWYERFCTTRTVNKNGEIYKHIILYLDVFIQTTRLQQTSPE